MLSAYAAIRGMRFRLVADPEACHLKSKPHVADINTAIRHLRSAGLHEHTLGRSLNQCVAPSRQMLGGKACQSSQLESLTEMQQHVERKGCPRHIKNCHSSVGG